MRKSAILIAAAASLLLSTIPASAGSNWVERLTQGDFIPMGQGGNVSQGDFNPGRNNSRITGDFRQQPSYGPTGEGDYQEYGNYSDPSVGDYQPEQGPDPRGCLPGDTAVVGCPDGGYDAYTENEYHTEEDELMFEYHFNQDPDRVLIGRVKSY